MEHVKPFIVNWSFNLIGNNIEFTNGSLIVKMPTMSNGYFYISDLMSKESKTLWSSSHSMRPISDPGSNVAREQMNHSQDKIAPGVIGSWTITVEEDHVAVTNSKDKRTLKLAADSLTY